jgi:tetratricopeptide (TPR) repeat protein
VRIPVALLLLAGLAFAQDAEEMARRYLAQEQQAFVHYRTKDYDQAVAAFERQIATFSDNPRPYYNIACCYALEGNAERAGTWLAIAISRGWRDARHLAGDPDFDKVRQSPEYIVCLARLKRARDVDPDPLPVALPPGSVPPAPSVSFALQLSQREERDLRRMEPLLGEHDYRKRLFAILDRRMAVLARYIIENGDARDAGDAAAARVGGAALYLQEAEGSGEPDPALRRAGAEYVLRTVEEFLRGYPGDPRLSGVLLARAAALEALDRADEAIPLLRVVRADHPERALQADLELAALLPPGDELRQVYEGLKERAEADLAPALRGRLMRARLLCEGMPDLADLDAGVAARIGAHEGLLAWVFVASGDSGSEETIKGLPAASARFLPVVVCVDRGTADAELAGWIEAHARSFPTIAHGAAAIDRVGLATVPLVVVARKDGTVVAVDPDATELAKLAGG